MKMDGNKVNIWVWFTSNFAGRKNTKNKIIYNELEVCLFFNSLRRYFKQRLAAREKKTVKYVVQYPAGTSIKKKKKKKKKWGAHFSSR